MLSILVAAIVFCMAVFFINNGTGLVSQLWQLNSFALVFLGTITATFLQFPLSVCRQAFKWIWVAFKPQTLDFNRDINWVCDVADTYYAKGDGALLAVIEDNRSPFFSKVATLMLDGASSDVVKQSGEATILAIQKRHEQGIFFFEQMAKYAPGFGLLGTVIGLIQLLSSLTNPSELGQGMALALVTTFYGIILSNLLFQPIAGRLFVLDQMESRYNDMMMIGIIGMTDRLPTLLIKEKMMMVIHNQRMVLE